MVRVTTGVEAHTHEYIATAHEDQKFGFSIAGGSAATRSRGLCGSSRAGPDRDPLPYRIADLRRRGLRGRGPANPPPACRLRRTHRHPAARSWTSEVASASPTPVRTRRHRRPSWPAPCGRSSTTSARRWASRSRTCRSSRAGRSAARARFALYTVGTVKPVELDGGASRLYVAVDGGMSDNIRTALYAAEYSATLASRRSSAPAGAVAGGRQALRGWRHPGPRRVPAGRHQHLATWSRCPRPGRTAGRWPATTTTCRGRRWSRFGTGGSRPCFAERPSRICWRWIWAGRWGTMSPLRRPMPRHSGRAEGRR